MLRGFVSGMVVDRDVRNLDATKVLRAELLIVRPMVEGRGANTWDVLKVLRGRQIIALHTVVVGDVGIQMGAQKLLGVSQDFALDMEGVRGVE